MASIPVQTPLHSLFRSLIVFAELALRVPHSEVFTRVTYGELLIIKIICILFLYKPVFSVFLIL